MYIVHHVAPIMYVRLFEPHLAIDMLQHYSKLGGCSYIILFLLCGFGTGQERS